MKQPEKKHSIVLLVDGLRPSALGPYGNTWFDTVYFNQLASQSLLFEKCIADTTDLQLGVGSLLSGEHALVADRSMESLGEHLLDRGVDFQILSYQPERFSKLDVRSDWITDLDIPKSNNLSVDVTDSRMGQFFGAAIEMINGLESSTCLILDCPGLMDGWDAPYAFRAGLTEEEDPDPSDILEPPSLQFNTSTDDLDLLLDFQLAYGGQIKMLDQLLGVLFDAIRPSVWGNSLFCLTSTAGFPLGEHGVVGYYRPVLYNELLHVPLLIRWPRPQVLGRSHCLIQPGSIFETLISWHQVDGEQPIIESSTFPRIIAEQLIPDERSSGLVSCIPDQDWLTVHTCHWKYNSGPHPSLYVKPDDLWEYNDVMGLCPEIGEQLAAFLLSAHQDLRLGRSLAFNFTDEVAFGVD
ncbi:MAG: hypothetical protein AAGA30_03835 [Planctomycetota bacterium]